MTRYIDADELKDWSEIIPLTDDGGIDINDFEEKLRTMPTIDAVPVIRCKDCKYYRDDAGVCIGFGDGHYVMEEDFCSKAERRDA